MPKRNVDFQQGRYYHIYNRGTSHQTIFSRPDNYIFALRRLKYYARALNISIVAYCLMPNHYHLLVRQDGIEPAGRLPQLTFNSYSKAFNRSCNRTGTLFEGRFKALAVEREEYLLHLCRYIHGNPVKGGIAQTPEEWPYSNYLEWVGLRDGALVDRAFVTANFGGERRYQEFVLAYLAGEGGLPVELAECLRELEA